MTKNNKCSKLCSSWKFWSKAEWEKKYKARGSEWKKFSPVSSFLQPWLNFILRYQENIHIQSFSHYWFSLKQGGDKQRCLEINKDDCDFQKGREYGFWTQHHQLRKGARPTGGHSSTWPRSWHRRGVTQGLWDSLQRCAWARTSHSHNGVEYRCPLPLLYDISNHISVFTPSRVKPQERLCNRLSMLCVCAS